MLISEITSPDLRLPNPTTPDQIIPHLESLLTQLETTPTLHSTLSPHFRHLTTLLTTLSPSLSNTTKLHLWKLSFRLWNTLVDITNSSSLSSTDSSLSPHLIHLRHSASDLLSLSSSISGVPSPFSKTASFYFKTGLLWLNIHNLPLASQCFNNADDFLAKSPSLDEPGERKLSLEVSIARAKVAWEERNKGVAITLLNRAKKHLHDVAEGYVTLAEVYVGFGKDLMREEERERSGGGASEAMRLMNEGLELCEKGMRFVKRKEETMSLRGLRDKTLRFIAALHLQKEEFESVVKCVRVLRESCSDEHPSLSVMAMKAWIGLERVGEAERELREMVGGKGSEGVPEGVWVGAVEAYFKAVGVAGVETVKSVFLGLLERCRVSAGAAVRVIYRVLGEGGGGEGKEGDGLRLREKIAAELAGDERVVGIFGGDSVGKERTGLHAVLWNCAAAHFRSKDYKISAELFEKAMLYVPAGVESRVLRAKGYRVLCLCHLGLSQLDQAKEYIDEAEKLEPNIACAFLKFKIFLQKNDHDAAISQMQAMMSCTDFTTEFLSLSAHEAVACRALTVAVASLSDLLNFYTSGKPMQIAEIVVLRTIITILIQEPGHELEILKFLKKSQARMMELGPANFFGKGEVGRRERIWFATNAWNIGTKAGMEKNFELCADFLSLAADFYGVIMDGEAEENSVMVCKSTVLAVSAMMAAEKQGKVAILDAVGKKAIELLDRAGKLVKTISSGDKLTDCQDNVLDENLYFVYTLIAFELYGRINDSASQQLVLKNYVNSKACNPKHLLQIGLTASQGPKINSEVVSATLNACLSALLASPMPDYNDIALILRRLISVAVLYKGDADDEVVYNLYRQAYQIMVGLREGEYPVTEGKWLATTAWNRAAVPVRLGQVEGSKKWITMGLELAKKVPGLETYRSCMEDYISSIEKTLQVK